MISSDRLALTVGSSKLVVDWHRRDPGPQGGVLLVPGPMSGPGTRRLVQWSREVYNGSLEHRRHAWHRAKGPHQPVSNQFNEVPSLREVCSQVARFGNQPVRGAISRVDEALRRALPPHQRGPDSGLSPFQVRRRFRTVMYDEPINWALKA